MIGRFLKANPFAFYAVAYGTSAAFHKGLTFILFMWLANSLSVQSYATFALLFALQSGVTILSSAGLIEAVIGLLKNCKSEESRAKLFNSANFIFLILSLSSIVLVLILSELLIDYIKASLFEIMLVVFGGVLIAYFTLQSQLVRLDEDHLTSLKLSFFPPLIGLLSSYIGFVYTETTLGFFSGFAVGMMFSLLLLLLRRFSRNSFIKLSHYVLPILKLIMPFFIIGILGWFSGYGNMYLVKSFFNSTDVARFMFAYTLSSIMQLVATSINQVWSPRAFKIINELRIEQVEIKSRRFFKFQGIALGAVGAVILILAPLVVEAVGKNFMPYRNLTEELFILFAAYAFLIPWYHVQNYYFALSKGKELMNITIITSIFGLALWWVCALFFGIIGAYIGYTVMMITRMLGALFWARREWAISVLWEGPVIALIFLTSATWVSRLITYRLDW